VNEALIDKFANQLGGTDWKPVQDAINGNNLNLAFETFIHSCKEKYNKIFI